MTRSYASDITIAADAFVDLQTHTNLSDGKWTPADLIDHFLSEGFATAAITDHDRVDTMVDIQHLAQARGFPLLVAVEMTTQWHDDLVDILCFGFEDDPAPLQTLCDRIHTAQSGNSRQVYENLVHSGYLPQHNETELASILGSTTANQTNRLVEVFLKHHPGTVDFRPLRDAGYQLCSNSTYAVVEAVHQGGGIALIAHPGRTDGFVTFDADLLDQFRTEIPIDGIEVYYPRHTPAQTALYQAYANQLGWFISAGSDSHTPDGPPIKYRASQCAALLARLDIQIKSSG